MTPSGRQKPSSLSFLLFASRPVQSRLTFPPPFLQLEIKCRPNPVIDIGNVDSGVALVLCDADAPDHPILYCSEPFMELTGYNSSEILGRNCRFLQHPPGGNRQCADRRINAINAIARREVKQTVSRGRETQTKFINYCKDGSAFVNILTLIPIRWMGRNYIVGFQADERILGR